jgi:hypothetical protein
VGRIEHVLEGRERHFELRLQGVEQDAVVLVQIIEAAVHRTVRVVYRANPVQCLQCRALAAAGLRRGGRGVVCPRCFVYKLI